jgi:hypothetical protein
VKPSRARYLWLALFALGFVNFLVFFAVAVSIGGDAANGFRSDGHYFLANHGKLTEVSESVWLYSRAHAYSVMITHPLAIFAGFMWNRTKGASISAAR